MTQLDYVKQIAADVREIKNSMVQNPPTTPPTNSTTVPTTTPPAQTSTLYIPETQASRWVRENLNNPDVSYVKRIADQPTGEWLGEWSGNVFDSVKSYMDKAGDKLAVFVAYNIPGRDNGNYSSGGLHSASEYFSWIGSIGAAIGDKKAIVVLEPDAVALSTDLDPAKKAERLTMIKTAVDILKKQPNLKVYLDASMWKTPQEMAELLKLSGIEKADGFACNVSGFKKTADCEAYGRQLQAIINKPFVIDTSRNGNGEWQTTEPNPWANPPGRALGNNPDLTKGYLWLKRPGESDGAIRGFPSAGTFVPSLAIEMSKNTK